ncbi:hypothetical protein RISK_001123 [Rhodopirellula islandica]|uniref:Uncharacterized protein n=1 Tax=Rhodopirellula islandica TaxID=595434 RepID=A0A0J1EMS1_RHOIS|nr:hypothetical protein RISK_001123 [Rhodopirellula islandica]
MSIESSTTFQRMWDEHSCPSELRMSAKSGQPTAKSTNRDGWLICSSSQPDA